MRFASFNFNLPIAGFAALALVMTACTNQDDTGALAEGDTAAMDDAIGNETTGAMDEMENVSDPAGALGLTIVEEEPYGEYVADASGRALYTFTADTQGESSACSGPCADAWPPLTGTAESIDLGGALDMAMVGEIQRDDGTTQITYNGWPLYYFARDAASGGVTGQDVHGFDAEWYLISPAGEVIQQTADGATGAQDPATGQS